MVSASIKFGSQSNMSILENGIGRHLVKNILFLAIIKEAFD